MHEAALVCRGQPVGELRKRFDAQFFPRPSGADELDNIRKASATARKLAALIVEIFKSKRSIDVDQMSSLKG